MESRRLDNEEDSSNINHNIQGRIQNVDRHEDEPNANMDVNNENDVIEDIQINNNGSESRDTRAEDDTTYESDSDEEFSSSESEADQFDEEDTVEEHSNREDNPTRRAIGLLLLKLRAETHISKDKIGSILQSMQDAVKEFVNFSLQQVEAVLNQKKNIQLREIFNIQEYVGNINFTNDFYNQKKRTKYFQREFDVVMPKKYILGRRFVKSGSARTSEERPSKVKLNTMYHVPLTKVLKSFFNNPTYTDIMDNHTPRANVLTSFKDGSKFETQTWRHDGSHQNIILYLDDVDMCDGLGSKAAGNQKLLMIYALNLQLHLMYRSSLEHIQLVGIAKSKDVKRYGLNSVMKPIVKNFKKLESGLNLDDGRHITGSLFATAEDNL